MSTTSKPGATRTHPPDALMHLVNPVIRALLRRGRGSAADRLLRLGLTIKRRPRPPPTRS